MIGYSIITNRSYLLTIAGVKDLLGAARQIRGKIRVNDISLSSSEACTDWNLALTLSVKNLAFSRGRSCFAGQNPEALEI